MRRLFTLLTTLLMTFMAWAQDANHCDLHKLVDEKAYAQISACVEAGSDPNVKDSVNRSLLTLYKSFALSRNSLKDPDIKRMVLTLIDKSIDVNYRRKEDESTPFENLLSVGENSETWDVIFAMLKAGADPNTKTMQYYDFKKSITPLLWAIKHHQHPAFDWLVAQGIPLNNSPDKLLSPLAHAVHYGNQHAFNALLNKGITFSTNESPLLFWDLAVDSTHRVQAIALLMQANMKPNWLESSEEAQKKLFNAVYQARLTNTPDVIRFLSFTLANKQNSLWIALFNADLLYWQLEADRHPQLDAIAQTLIEQGESVRFVSSQKHNSLLQIMVEFMPINLSLAEVLIKAGAQIQHQDTDGDTPLHEIVYELKKLQTEKQKLIAQGTKSTNRYAPENDINEILALALKGSPKIVKSDINEASQSSLRAYYQLLLRYGADENLANKKGETAKQLMSELAEQK